MLSSVEQDILTVFNTFEKSITGSEAMAKLNEVRALHNRAKCLCGSFYPVVTRLCDTGMLFRNESGIAITEKGLRSLSNLLAYRESVFL